MSEIKLPSDEEIRDYVESKDRDIDWYYSAIWMRDTYARPLQEENEDLKKFIDGLRYGIGLTQTVSKENLEKQYDDENQRLREAVRIAKLYLKEKIPLHKRNEIALIDTIRECVEKLESLEDKK